jgi:uncharacterized protein
MKFLLVIAVVLIAFWIWRNNRQSDRGDDAPPATPRPGNRPARMVACSHCGTHVPETEQLIGRHGVYCCAEHRRQAQDTDS